jgi:hypothetical protein
MVVDSNRFKICFVKFFVDNVPVVENWMLGMCDVADCINATPSTSGWPGRNPSHTPTMLDARTHGHISAESSSETLRHTQVSGTETRPENPAQFEVFCRFGPDPCVICDFADCFLCLFEGFISLMVVDSNRFKFVL